MAKRAKRPDGLYQIIDRNGYFCDSESSLSQAQERRKDYDKDFPGDAPHSVHTLVTLKERAVVRAAKRAVNGTGTWSDLVKAVEAADG